MCWPGCQLVGGVNLLGVVDPHGLHAFLLLIVFHHQPAQNLAIQAAQRGRGQDAFRRAAGPITACTPVPATAAAIPADRSPSPIRRMRAPASRMSAISF